MESIGLKDWATLIAALVAAVTGLYSAWRQFAASGDRLYVGAGSMSAIPSQGEDLYVVNRSAHRVRLHDYGAILFSGECHSYPWAVEMAQFADDFSGYLAKSIELNPRESTEAGMEIRGRVAGVYAQTTTQRWPCLRFYGSTPWHTRIKLRIQIVLAAERHR